MGYTLRDVKEFLLRKEQGTFEPDSYLEAWMSTAVSTYFLERAVEVIPTAIRFGIGRPFECHRNSLEYASGHPGATAWFGFQNLHLEGEEEAWYLHSFATEPHGTLIDSGEYVPQAVRYFAVEWSWQLFNLMRKRVDQ